jgi:hypothetical protein
MKPKELIKESLQETIAPELVKFNFTFSGSALKFSRKWSDFTHTINVISNRWNAEDVIVEFDTRFGISSKKFVKWYLQEYGEKPLNDGVAGEADWNLNGWTYPQYKTFFRNRFDLAEEKDRKRVLDILLSNIINIGIPFLEKHSDWEIEAKRLIEQRLLHSRACDFYLIAGDKAKAYQCLKDGQKLSWNQLPDEPEAIKLRLKKHFNE